MAAPPYWSRKLVFELDLYLSPYSYRSWTKFALNLVVRSSALAAKRRGNSLLTRSSTFGNVLDAVLTKYYICIHGSIDRVPYNTPRCRHALPSTSRDTFSLRISFCRRHFLIGDLGCSATKIACASGTAAKLVTNLNR